MGLLTSKSTSLIVTPPVPAYLERLGSFQSRELTGAYGPSGSFGKTRALDALLQGWATTHPSFDSSALYFFDYSGGCPDDNNKRIFAIGGGHNSTACNGVFYFDATDDGTGRPRGFFGVPGSFTRVADMTTAAYINGPTLPDGRPNSCHSYQSPVFYGAGNRFVKIGFSSSFLGQSGNVGSSRGWIDMNNSQAWPSNSWTIMSSDTGIAPGGEGDYSLISPNGDKALYGGLRTGGSTAYFYRFASDTWSGAKSIGADVNPGWVGSHNRLVWDTIRNKALRVVRASDQSGYGLMDIDWTTETLSNQQALTITGDLTQLSANGQAVWFDPARQYRGTGAQGVIWVLGGRSTGHTSAIGADVAYQTITEIGYTNSTTRAAVRYNLTGTKPLATYGVDGVGNHGLNQRMLFVDAWRAVVLVPSMNRGAWAIKLPQPTEVT
jgi:hypothetical protein